MVALVQRLQPAAGGVELLTADHLVAFQDVGDMAQLADQFAEPGPCLFACRRQSHSLPRVITEIPLTSF